MQSIDDACRTAVRKRYRPLSGRGMTLVARCSPVLQESARFVEGFR